MANRYGYGDEKTDKWFLWQGQEPPERFTHLTEEELEQALQENLSDHTCEWQQNGAEIFCDTGGRFEHGRRIGVNLRLAGTDNNNQPVLVSVGPILRTDIQ